MALWYCDITISPSLTGSDLTNFPMTLYGDGWPNSGFWDRVRSDLMDVHFKLQDGTALDREIEAGSVDVANKKMICHVRLPAYSATTGASIRAFFGDGVSRANATGTWNSAYAAVWHLGGQTPPASILDSTANAKNLTPANMDSSNLTTIGAGVGLQFNGSDEYAEISQALITTFSGGFTIEAIQRHTVDTFSAVVSVSNSGTAGDYVRITGAATNIPRNAISTSGTAYNTDGTTSLTNNLVTHNAFVCASATNRRTYVNGSQEGSTSTNNISFPSSCNTTSIGRTLRTTSAYSAGALREVRISTTARLAAWVQATHRALLSPGTYYTVSPARQGFMTLGQPDWTGAQADDINANQKIVSRHLAASTQDYSHGAVCFNTRSTTAKTKMVVYSDNAGNPDALLATSNELTGTGDGISFYTFSSPVSLTAGSYYWVGYIIDTGSIQAYLYPTGGTSSVSSDTYSDGPADPYGTGTAGTRVLCAYLYANDPGVTVFKALLYAVLTPPAAEPVSHALDLRWSLTSARAAVRDLRWSLTAPVAPARDLRWSLIQTITPQSDIRWALAQSVTPAADFRWALTQSVVPATDIRWALTQSVALATDLRWALIQTVVPATDLRWALTQSVTPATDLRWMLTSAVAKDADWRWAIEASVARAAEIRWMIEQGQEFTAVAQDLSLCWALTQSVSDTISVLWSRLAKVAPDNNLRWSLTAAVTSSADLRWSIFSQIQRMLDLDWQVLARMDVTRDVLWAITNAVAQGFESRYTITALAQSEVTLDWSMLGQVQDELTLQFALRSGVVYTCNPIRVIIIHEDQRTTVLRPDNRAVVIPADLRLIRVH